jgi:hypothetical protein
MDSPFSTFNQGCAGRKPIVHGQDTVVVAELRRKFKQANDGISGSRDVGRTFLYLALVIIKRIQVSGLCAVEAELF